jgi:hypothetical protein
MPTASLMVYITYLETDDAVVVIMDCQFVVFVKN